MVQYLDLLAVIGLFVLRLGVPVAIILLLGYGLKRLDRRWEAEARIAAGMAQQPAKPQPAPKRGVDVPGMQLPYDPGMVRQPSPAMAGSPTKHCWEVHGCSEQERAACPAHATPDLPCWQARLRSEKQMPQKCFDCEVFKNYPHV